MEPARWCLTVAAQQERHQLAIARYEAKQVAQTSKPDKPEPGQTWAAVLHADLVISAPSGDAQQSIEPQAKAQPRIVEWAEAEDSDSECDADTAPEEEKLWEQAGLEMEQDDEWKW
eukprot:4029341-Amphidinium_carterae.1